MEEASNATVPGFLIKLWTLVDDTNLDDVIRWSEVYLHGERIGCSRGVRVRKGSFQDVEDLGQGPRAEAPDHLTTPRHLGIKFSFFPRYASPY